MDLPMVDEAFAFDEFVAKRSESAKTCQENKDWKCLRKAVEEILGVDPIHPEALSLRERVALYEAAEQALAKAERLASSGKYADAYRVLLDVPDELPQAPAAKKRAKDLRHLAIEDQLARAERDLKSKRRWKRAHERYKAVLGEDPNNTEALRGLRAVEKKMRKRNMAFSEYVPKTDRRVGTAPSGDMEIAIVRHFDGDKKLAAVARTYQRGAVDQAIRQADNVSRRGDGVRRRRARKLGSAMREIQKRFGRIRTEIGNDPARAWSMLRELQRAESAVLPKGVKSYVVRELESNLSEAYAEQGASMFDRGRLEDAFERWESGYKLDPTNPKVIAGLRRLEEKANAYAQEAELAAQRGERDVCDRWKRITRITNRGSEIHEKARKRAMLACG
jgi:tetratricopeptide (TPR) repeat protein